MWKQKIIFDTDCLSSFLWVDRIDILEDLFPKQLFITDSLYNEVSYLKRGKHKHVYDKLEDAVKSGIIQILSINVGSDLSLIRDEISSDYSNRFNKIIGDGELDMLALAKYHNCICLVNTASNNIKDILWYLKKEEIKNITTMDILCYSYEQLGLEFKDLDVLKKEMINKKRQLPKDDVESYYKNKYNTPFEKKKF